MKKSLILIIIVIVVIIAGVYLWRGGFLGGGVDNPISPTGETTSQAGIGGQVSEPATGVKTGTAEKINDDVYVELMAQAAYLSQKNPTNYISLMKDFYDKYGLTQESFAAYGEELGKDPARTQAIAQKYMKRLQELMK